MLTKFFSAILAIGILVGVVTTATVMSAGLAQAQVSAGIGPSTGSVGSSAVTGRLLSLIPPLQVKLGSVASANCNSACTAISQCPEPGYVAIGRIINAEEASIPIPSGGGIAYDGWPTIQNGFDNTKWEVHLNGFTGVGGNPSVTAICLNTQP
jgi:hypothetical protein